MYLMGNRSSRIYMRKQLSEKMADGSKKVSFHEVKPGALIEISRKNKQYEDWALCVKENEVIHVVELCDRKAIIKQEKLEKVVGSDQWCVNHCLDEIYGATDVQLMLEEAQKMNDTEVPYSLLTNYGKHKFTKWRRGKPELVQVEPGDMIEISRKGGLYKHWALYMGENEVINVYCQSPTKAIIKQEKLEKVVGSDKWRVNNYVDEIYGARDIKVILDEAQELKDKEVPYNVLTNNCEHMVTKLRCGKAMSRQAQMAGMLMFLVLFVVVPIKVYWIKRRPVQRQVTGMHHRRSITGRTEPVRHQGRQRSSTGPTEDKG
ncbi:phospholipase A and acyltransferase 5-like, partial [Anguilla rostrata]|uniref:phospholipase A and acyltransferase 5-like n=1 Tax=Anguilla rostrata TaxID=7938 RepID=UPI0030CEEBCB